MAKKSAKKHQKANKTNEHNISLHRQLRANSYSSSLDSIRKMLPKKQQRIFSRFIHARGMDSINDLLSWTIGRPLSIIGGSIFALVGTFIGVYLAKHFGYQYNYLLLFLFFVLGYMIELLIESILKFFVKSKN